MATSFETTSQVEPARAHLSGWKKLGLIVWLLAIALGAFAWLRPLAVVRTAAHFALWRGGIHSRYTQVGGYRIHYYEGGEGPPLVFVHGLGAEALNWVPAMLDMRRQFHVYAMDLLGHGDSQKPDIAYSIEQQSEMLRQFLATQNIKSADVVGVSMGGWVALKLAIEHPEAVNRLVVADAAGLKFQTNITVKEFPPGNAGRVQCIHGDADAAAVSRAVPGAAGLPEPGGRARVDHSPYLRLVSHLSGHPRRQAGGSQVSRAGDLGKQEKLIPLSVGEEMKQQLPNASLLICSDSGHLAVYECWNKLEPDVATFLSSPQPPAPYVREVASGVGTVSSASAVIKAFGGENAAQR